MNRKVLSVFAGFCGLLMLAACATVGAQEVKPKQPMYTYVGSWILPSDHWGEANKANDSIDAAMDKSMSDGTLVGHGRSRAMVHTMDGSTHSTWWCSNSMGGLMKALDALYAAGVAPNPGMASAKAHWDNVYVSRFYSTKAGGSYKDGYLHGSVYQLRETAPDDAIDMIAEHLVVPMLDKQMADGTIVAYQIMEEAIHTDAPGSFVIVYITPTADGLDTMQAAIRDTVKAHPLGGEAFGDMTVDAGHRDFLEKGDGKFK